MLKMSKAMQALVISMVGFLLAGLLAEAIVQWVAGSVYAISILMVIVAILIYVNEPYSRGDEQ